MTAPEYTKRYRSDNVYRTDPDEVFIMDNWDAAETLASSTDPSSNYSFDDYDLVKIGNEYFVLNGSGCSCPLMEEVWGVCHRGDKESTEKYLATSKHDSEALCEFQRTVYALGGWNVPNPKPRTSYDW